jgi:hypothetical protein
MKPVPKKKDGGRAPHWWHRGAGRAVEEDWGTGIDLIVGHRLGQGGGGPGAST